ncbi:MAG: thermonuclease family protein [Paracoccaceae bacterium]|nr:thermonuclease family protein [Paracoccaceae bacterium]
MGLPPHRPSRWRRMLRRVLHPVFYLKLVMLAAGLGLVVLPYGTDVLNAALKPVASSDGSCRVLVVLDGDTVKLVCPGRGVETARLMGFDAPEKYSPRCASELVAAEKATWGLRGMIFKAKSLAVAWDGTDRYGRALVRLRLDGVDVARLMIRAGHGRAYSGGPRGGWC